MRKQRPRLDRIGYYRPHGFRFSLLDGVMIALSLLAAWRLRFYLGELALIFPSTLAHFFLFCNVFRVHRYSELLWAAVFILNILAWTAAGRFAWSSIILTQAPFTLAAIVIAIASPTYHGIFSRAAVSPSPPGPTASGSRQR